MHSGPVARTVPIKKPRARLIYITIRVNQMHQAQEGEDRFPAAGPRALLSWFQSGKKD